MTAAPPPLPVRGPAAAQSPLLAGSPAAALYGSDRVEVARPVGLAVLGRLDRLGRGCGPVVGLGGVAAFLLAPGIAETVPELLCWLGWGAELGLALRPRQAGAPVPRPRGAEEMPPRPERTGGPVAPAVWLRRADHGPGLDLDSPALLRLLDCLADACARDLMGLAPQT
ncbi:hypothetical protein [Kitasatospora sp. McL0602]|uniref:hypothetical protein n=1 Tax=Kitasatospora sp. McL0602 TaxID=3439530 RepID=UPI003F8B0413